MGTIIFASQFSLTLEKKRFIMTVTYLLASNMFFLHLEIKICSPEHFCSTTVLHYYDAVLSHILSKKNCSFCDFDVELGHVATLIIFRLIVKS